MADPKEHPVEMSHTIPLATTRTRPAPAQELKIPEDLRRDYKSAQDDLSGASPFRIDWGSIVIVQLIERMRMN